MQRASANLPSNFDGLQAISVTVEDGYIARDLSCACGANWGAILATPSEGELQYLDPLSFECGQCGRVTKFFDSQTDGYDGRLNDGACYEQGSEATATSCTNCNSTAAKLNCGLTYNIDFAEDDQPELVADAENYFDSIDVIAHCAKCGKERHVGTWEVS
jgi:hypothetical protein